MSPTKYTRAVLEPIVREARSLTDVLRKLGLKPSGGNHRLISSRVRLAELDTSHFRYRATELAKVSDDELRAVVAQVRSVAQVLVRLGLPRYGWLHTKIRDHIAALGIETSHFTRSAWARGESAATHPALAVLRSKNRRPDEEVFVQNSPEDNGRRLVRRLLAMGWEYRCSECGIVEWRGAPLVLHLDHINGIANDNRFENLRLLCPNCHSQTDTYCGRNRR